MNCAVHPEQQASGYCRHCGKAMCSACARPVRDVLYCEDCLASTLGHAAPGQAASASGAAAPAAFQPAPARSSISPGIAFLLGLCPGLGAVYNGEYNKALIHVLVFVALIIGVSTGSGAGSETVLGLMIAGFVLYMAIDAMRTAQARLAGQPSPDPLETWGKQKPVGPMILIALGVLFLLGNFGFLPWERFSDFWPLILIAVGILMLRKRIGRSS
jgi:hypothetical protein